MTDREIQASDEEMEQFNVLQNEKCVSAKEEKLNDLMNKISFALKDATLAQGFEIICKRISELEEENERLQKVILEQNILNIDLMGENERLEKEAVLVWHKVTCFDKPDENGFITMHDWSSGHEVDTDYSIYDFNQKFAGLQFSTDPNTGVMTLNVTKVGGYTLDDCCLSIPSDRNVANEFVITGEPLTINVPDGCTEQGIEFSVTKQDSKGLLVIDSDVTIVGHDASSTETTGMTASMLQINKDASLTITGFDNGLCLTTGKGQTSTVNGTLNVSGKSKAFTLLTNDNQAKTLTIADSYLDVYADGTKQTISNHQIQVSKKGRDYYQYKHVAIIPSGANINDYNL